VKFQRRKQIRCGHHGNRGHKRVTSKGCRFLEEAIRQFILEGRERPNVLNMARHAGFPTLEARARTEDENQRPNKSVAKLREIGLQPQVLICAGLSGLLDSRSAAKSSQCFCSASRKKKKRNRKNASVPAHTHTIYEVPLTSQLRKFGTSWWHVRSFGA